MKEQAPARARILVIEDDAAISDIVCSTLSGEGYACTPAYSGSEAKLRLESVLVDGLSAESLRTGENVLADGSQDQRPAPREFPYDLIICDLMLPGLSGEEVVDLVRQVSNVPILITSAKAEVVDRVALLRAGVDDYLVKPFDLDELVARVEALLRRSGKWRQNAPSGECGASKDAMPGATVTSDMGTRNDGAVKGFGANEANASASGGAPVLVFGKWMASESERTFEVAGTPIRLTRTEFDLITALMRHPRKVFTKQELYEAAWHEEALVEEKAINTHISNIRSKLRPTGTDSYIETVWGIGFKLADKPE